MDGTLTGDGIQLLFLKGKQSDYGNPPAVGTNRWWEWLGYRWWSEGTVKIDGSAFSEWSVVLQGQNRE